MTVISNPAGLSCDTCKKDFDTLYRVVLDSSYNALSKRPIWNCKDCYKVKNEQRITGDVK